MQHSTTTTKQSISNIILNINNHIESLLNQSKEKDQKIQELQKDNKLLKQNSEQILNQINGYLSELEEIKDYYVNSINKSR